MMLTMKRTRMRIHRSSMWMTVILRWASARRGNGNGTAIGTGAARDAVVGVGAGGAVVVEVERVTTAARLKVKDRRSSATSVHHNHRVNGRRSNRDRVPNIRRGSARPSRRVSVRGSSSSGMGSLRSGRPSSRTDFRLPPRWHPTEMIRKSVRVRATRSSQARAGKSRRH